MKDKLAKEIDIALKKVGVDTSFIHLDYPDDDKHGDFFTNIALTESKKLGLSPEVLAKQIIAELNNTKDSIIKKVEFAKPGFINIFVKDEFFQKELEVITSKGRQENEEILIEYTDPNAFKAFHIGHLMSNAIGESISRIIEANGKKIKRICYPSDIGLHIAKAIWAIEKNIGEMPKDEASIIEKTDFLGKMYVLGTEKYDADLQAKKEIDELNTVLYAKSDPKINQTYEKGKKWSLDHFELLYNILGTKFDDTIYESEVAPIGLQIVKEYEKRGIFEQSDGAIVYKGEKFGLHTRVFVNSHGIPTYEAKDIGLNVTKFKKYPDAISSIIITANEQDNYFKVVISALKEIDANIGEKTKHIGHGMMRFESGKMSSRKGNVVTAEQLIYDIKEMVKEKMVDRKFSPEENESIATKVAVAAIKYTILRQATGGNIIFDSAKSISFEGDSGPYLQYTAVRAQSVLNKAKNIPEKLEQCKLSEEVGELEKMLSRYKDIVERAGVALAPQIIATYMIELCGAFNSFYNSVTIINDKDPLSQYYLYLTKVLREVLVRGLHLLAIEVPEKM